MTKILIEPKTKDEITALLKLNIDGIILGINNLCVNTAFSLSVNEIKKLVPKIKEKNIEIFILLNKNMHNNDLKNLEKALYELNKININKIMFYDLSVIKLCEKLNIKKELVIYQNHLNASIYSNNFYNSLGIKYSVITSEITLEEILEINKKSSINLIIPSYGYRPIFYSRRNLLNSYFKYINKKQEYKFYYIKEKLKNEYNIIKEEKYGTTIYTNKILNLIKEYKIFCDNNISYIILNGEFIDEKIFINEIINYIALKENKNIEYKDNYWTGFLYNKTVYRVKNDK